MIKNYIKIPNILFHATFKKNMKNILKNGLIPGHKKNWEGSKNNVVYLASTLEEAGSYCESVEDDYYIEDDIFVIAIDSSKLDLNKIYPDSNVIDGNSTFEYNGQISPDCFINVKKFE